MAGKVGKAIKGFGKALGDVKPKTPKKKSEYRLRNQLRRIQKEPDKKFKHQNPATEKAKTRHGFVYDRRKNTPVKGSLGKKTYKSDVTQYHRAHQRMGLIKD